MEPESSTQRLIQRAREGDRAAFDLLVEEHRSRLEALIGARIGAHVRSEVDAADVLQETLLQALRSIERFRWQDEDSFLRWLGGIAEHVILKAATRSKRHQVLRLCRDLPASGPSPSRASRREERFDRLTKALAALTPEHREVIRLARLDGLDLKEIARRMERSTPAVKQLLGRALRKLWAAFGETESFHLPDRVLDAERSVDGD